MAPKSLSIPQPSKREEALERPTSSEERDDEQESEEEGDEEENSSGEEDQNSSGEEDQEKSPKILPKYIAQENGSESESESEPESDDSPSAYKMQPISKASATASKRKNQEISNGESNKRTKTEEKKSDSVVPPTPGGSGFITRLWTDDDEIALLNRMVDFKKSKNSDFGGAFYDTIKGKLRVDFSRDQLRTKISRIKKRFLNALKKGQNGSDPVFSKPHDVMVFELSKKIWVGESGNKNDSSEGAGEKSKKNTVKGKKIVRDEEEVEKNKNDGGEGLMWSKFQFLSSSFDNLVGKFPSLGMSDSGISLVKEKLSSIGNLKAKELDEKWKQMLLEETDIHYRMLSVMREQIKLVLDR